MSNGLNKQDRNLDLRFNAFAPQLRQTERRDLYQVQLSERHRIPQHFTASAVVIQADHILLVHHRRIGAWLPPGGHIESFEMPHEAAIREVREETGVAVTVISPELPDTGDHDAFFLASPLCVHCVKAVENSEALYHLDLAYLCRTVPAAGQPDDPALPPLIASAEVKESRWIKLSDLGDWPLAKNVPEIVELATARLKLIPDDYRKHI